MRPAPIPDEVVAQFHGFGGDRRVIGPPDNDLDSPIAPVEVMHLELAAGHAFRMRVILEPGDIERLSNGGAIWLTMLGHVVPFDMEVGP